MDWELIDQEDGVVIRIGEARFNLGDRDDVVDKLADYLGLPGDSIDIEKTEGEPEWG